MRIPVRCRSEIILVPVALVATVLAKGQKLTITTTNHQQYIIDYRLKGLESRLNPDQFVRLNRGTLVNLDAVSRIVVERGGGNRVILANGQELHMSRLQARRLRRTLLRL